MQVGHVVLGLLAVAFILLLLRVLARAGFPVRLSSGTRRERAELDISSNEPVLTKHDWLDDRKDGWPEALQDKSNDSWNNDLKNDWTDDSTSR